MDFKVGDIVKLKSGGPAMTVASVQDDQIFTKWFSSDNSASMSGNFHKNTLALVVSDHQDLVEDAKKGKKL